MCERFEHDVADEELVFVKVGSKTIGITESHQEYLTFLEEALKRNLSNCDLPYFSRKDLEKDEIVADVKIFSRTETSYNGSYSRRYSKIYCGNIVIDTNSYSPNVSVTIGNIKWSRYHEYCELHAPSCEIEMNPSRAVREALNRCCAFLDVFELDFSKFAIIYNFEKECKSVNDGASYRIGSISVSRLKRNHSERIAFYVYKRTPGAREKYKLLLTTFIGLVKMDVHEFLNDDDWRS